VGEENDFHGIADLLTDSALLYDGVRRARRPFPTSWPTSNTRYASNWWKDRVGDDGLMERYLEGEIPSTEELETTLASGVAEGLVFPWCADRPSPGSASTAWPRSWPRSPLTRRAAPGAGAAGDTEQEVAANPPETPGPGVQDHLRSLRGQDLPPARHLGHHSSRLRPHQSRTHSEAKLHALELLRVKRRNR